MNDDELDVELLMHDLCRRLEPGKLPGGSTVVRFSFRGLESFPQWWIVVEEEKPELCVVHPGRNSDVAIRTDARTMIEVYTGDVPLVDARREGRMEVTGSTVLVRSIGEWLPVMAKAHVKRGDEGPGER